MGYKKEMHLFGIDSCYADDESTHVGGSIVEQQLVKIRVCGRWFTVAPWMAMQASDFKAIAPLFSHNGIRLIVHGTGLIPYIATFFGLETPDMRVTLLEKLRRLSHSLYLLYIELRSSPQLLGGSYAGI